MRLKQKIIIALLGVTLASPYVVNTTNQAYSATFTQTESKKVRLLQDEYQKLPKTVFSRDNIYSKTPHLTAPFSAGNLNDTYVSDQLAYINFYRSLFGLPKITSSATDNKNAQITASVMAAINADPFVNQHGLPNDVRPIYIKKKYWSLAQNVSATSNLNFNVADQSAGDVITDLLTDSYNLDGSDTGHRAWILSSRLTTTGIGAAYGSNGYRYSVQQVVYPSDTFRAASTSTVAYPTSGIFPIELLQGKNIAWSLYLSDKAVVDTPKITITDLDTGKTVKATNVNNYSNQGYGNFSTIITYFPGKLKLVAGHSYSVKIKGVYNYTFKLYKLDKPQKATSQAPVTSSNSLNIDEYTTSNNTLPVKSDSSTDSSNQIKANENSANDVDTTVNDVHPNHLLAGNNLRDSLVSDRQLDTTIFGRSYQDGKSYYNLGSNQWFNNFYVTSNPQLDSGLVNITDSTLDRNVYSSPYNGLQVPTFTKLTPGKSYPYGQTITIGDTVWYYLGPHQWFKQPLGKTNNLV